MKDTLKKLFASSLILLLIWGWSHAAEAETQVMNGVDDSTVHINLGHNFPYYGGVFTDAWMSSNGFIILYDPTKGYGNSNTAQSWCNTCPWGYSGGPPQGRSNLSYMIAPMWSDFRHNTNVTNSGYFYETGSDGTWFEWRNVIEYGTNNQNTFGLQLWADGSFDFQYAEVDVRQHDVWIGFTGDTTSQSGNVYNEVNELFYNDVSVDGNMQTSAVTGFTDAETNYGYAWWGQDGGYSSIDCSNPLNDTSCPGYDEAYFNQQCEQNPLYDTQCSGYAEAYYNQQCTADPLYDSGCPGYAEAYYDQQCDLDALYDSGCPGYAQAYFDQQCGLDALYDSQCPGYAEAYYEQQCTLDALYDTGCVGYDAAYFDYQCTLNPQYDKMCPGWVDPDLFKDPVDDLDNESMGIDDGIDDGDDGSDDGSKIDAFGNQKEEEMFFVEDPIEDLVKESYMEDFFDDEPYDPIEQETFMDKDEKMFTEELVSNDGSVDEMKVLEESVFFEEEEPVEEEIEILEKEEIVEVMEEEVLEEEVELDTVELVTITEKVTATPKVNVTSLILQQTSALVAELRSESEQSGTESASNSVNSTNSTQTKNNSTQNVQKTQENRSQVVQNVQSVENLSVDGSEMASSDGFYGTNLNNFTSMTQNVSNDAESVSQNEQTESDVQNVEQNLALGDSAPIGFAIVPVQGVNGVEMVMVPVEEQSLAERLAERVRQRNMENSNVAAVGQTAVLQNIASATNIGVYYDKTTTYTQDVYSQEQVYGNVGISDNARSHYKIFSENHGTMQELIRSQY